MTKKLTQGKIIIRELNICVVNFAWMTPVASVFSWYNLKYNKHVLNTTYIVLAVDFSSALLTYVSPIKSDNGIFFK